MNKSRRPINNKDEAHGFWEVYYYDKLHFRGTYINGWKRGYWERYNGKKEFYLK